jgi:GH25 family lysozyme M1 (1,4-beta-N-acetylmuramidase)
VDFELGRKTGIYTGRNVWKYQFGDTDEFADRSLWQVSYSSAGATAPAPPPFPFSWIWDLWQWSGSGDFDYYEALEGPVPGIPNPIDVNRIRGNAEGLARLTSPDSGSGAGVAAAFGAAPVVAAAAFFATKGRK